MIFGYDKKNGISTIFNNFSKTAKKQFVQVEADASKIFSKIPQDAAEGANWDDFIKENNINSKTMQSFLKDETIPTKDLDSYISYVQQAESATSRFSGVLGTLKSVGLNALGSLATMGATMLASWAIGEIVQGIVNWIRADEIAIEKGKEATQSIQDRYDAFTKLKDAMASTEKQITGKDEAGTSEESIKKIAQRYDELHDGVNELNNANENLSTDKYQEYLDLCNQLAEQSPSLVSGYDSQGNAILNLGNTASEAEQALMRMYEASKLAANVGMGEDLQASYDGFITQIKQYTNNNEKLQDDLKELQDASDKNAQEQAKGVSQSLLSISGRSVTLSNYDMDKERTLRDILGDYGILLDSSINGLPVTGEDYTFVAEGIQDLSQETIDTINKTFYDATKSSIEASGNQISADINSVQNQISSNNLFIEDQKKAITGVISNYLNTSDIFGDQNEEIQNAILANLNNLDLSVIADKYKGQIVPYIYGELIRPLKDDFSPEVQKALTDAFAIDTKNISAGEYISSLQETLSKSFNGDANKVVQWRSLLGIDDIFNEVTSGIQSVSNEFLDENGEQTLSQEQLESLYGLSLDDLRIYADLVKDGVYNTWEELQKAFEDTKKKSTPEREDTLATLFGSEDYKADAEKYESNLSTLSSALETLRTEGSLTAEEMTNLQESFPDLTEFTTDALNEKAFKNLNDWISKIRENMDGMSDEGKQQAQTYIKNLADSYGDLGLSLRDVKDFYWDLEGAPEMKGRTGLYDTRVESLRQRLASEGRELDTHVLYTIIAQDQFSGDADAIYNAYNDAEVHWKITLDNQNIEKDIEKQQAIIENESSRRSLKEAQGQTLTPDDYRTATESAKQIARDREKQYEMALSERDKITDKESDEYKAANNDVINAEKEMLDAKANAIQTEKEGIEAYTDKYQKAVTEADNAVTKAQNAIDQAESQYGEGNADQKLYDALAKAYSQRSGAYNELSDAWMKLSKNHPEYFDEYMANALSAQSSATSDTESAKQQQGMDLQQRYNDLQTDATKLQRELTVAEQKHQKVSKQTYQDLIKNGQNQIKILRKQQEEADGNIDKIREYQDQIDSMNDSIYEWGNTMENLVVDQATSLASALSTAFSESMSETGLTSDTINQLVTGFSDVLGKDFDQSDMFYATADGVKVNADALRELTEAEYELQAVDLQNEIDATREAMENAPTNTIYDAAKEKLEQLMQTQSQFFVQYEEMQKALSDYNALQIAQSTENQGAVYDSLTSTYKSMKEAYDNGFTGTDEFKAFTKLADAYGRTTTEAYEAVAPKLERYLTEDPYAGTENFLQDLKSLGFAEQDAEGTWSWRIEDMNEAAQKMGIGVELFNSMFGKLEEYDFSNYVVESLTEAQLKTQQLEMDLEQAEQTYADMFKAGASSDDLEKQKEVIDDIRDSFENIEMAKDDYLNNQAQKQKNDFMNLDNTLKMYQDMYTEATSDEERENIHEMAEREVSQYGYSLKVDSIELTDEAQADFQDRMSNISVDLSKYQQGFIQAGQGKEFNQFKEYYENNTEAAQDYLSVLSKISKEDLSKVSLSNGEYEIDPEAEDALQGLADATGFTNENMEVLLTLIGLVNDELGEIEVPKGTSLESILSTTTKGSGAGYDIDLNPQYSQMSADQLNTQLSEIGQLRLEIASDSPAYQELQELEEGAQLELEIREKVSTGEYSLESIRDLLAQGATAEDIAINLGINADEEGLATVNRLIEMAQNSALVIQIDSSQFDQLLNTIATGELPEAEIKVKADDTEFQTTLQEDIDAAHTEVSTGNGVHAGGGSTTGYAYKVGSETQQPQKTTVVNKPVIPQVDYAEQIIKFNGELDSQQVQSDINALISQPNYMQVDIGANISEAEGQLNKVEQEAESSKPKITPQVVVQKAMSGIQNFVQKVQGSIQKVSSASPTAEMNVDNSNVEKGTSEATKDVKKFDKTSGTAKVTVDTSQAMAAIAGLRANLQALSGIRPSISVESGSINTAISRAQSLIAKLNEAAAKKVSVGALGSAYASGTIGKINSTIHKTSTPISHAYAGGTQDWTVGKDEEALVNELGQESIVIFCDFIR